MTKTPRGLNEAPSEYKLEDTSLQIRKIGNSVGVILPKELLARLNLKEGDKFYPVEQPDGSLRLSPFNPKHARTMGRRPAVGELLQRLLAVRPHVRAERGTCAVRPSARPRRRFGRSP